MSLNNIQDYFSFELEYKVTNSDYIKIFDSRFIYINRNKCKIIYDGKENEIIGFLKSDSYYKHNDSIKIKLIIDNNITDMNYMFEDCKSLLSIRDISVDISDNNNMNKSFYEYNSNNSSEKSDILNTNEKGESFYSEYLTFSGIQKNSNSSEYSGINVFWMFFTNIIT